MTFHGAAARGPDLAHPRVPHVGVLALAGIALLTLACERPDRAGLQTLTTIEQVRALGATRAERRYPVVLRGITTYYDADWRSVIIQSGDGGVLVDTSGVSVPVAVGREVTVEGFTAARESSPIVVAVRFGDLREATLPPAQPVSAGDLASGAFSYRRVEAEGVVRSFKIDTDGYDRRFTLSVADAAGTFEARILGGGPTDAEQYIDSTIKITGVAYTLFNLRRQAVRLQILVPAVRDVQIRQAAAADPYSVSLQSIRTLLQMAPQAPPRHRVRIRGLMAAHADGTAWVDDATGGIQVSNEPMADARSGAAVEVLGFIARTGGVVVLEDSVSRRLDRTVAAEPAGGAVPKPAAVDRATLETVSAVRSLSPAAARLGRPVRFRAVVTYVLGPNFVFVQDGTAGIFMVNGGEQPSPGQLVEVSGQTAAGDFAPIVDKGTVRVIGRASMPDPIRLPATELFTGQYDSQWVETEGIVQGVERTDEGRVAVRGFRIVQVQGQRG